MNGERSYGSDAHRQAITALALLAALSLLNFYDRMLVVVISQPLRLEFQLTDTQYGLLTGSAFALVYAVSSIVFGYFADRGNRRIIVAVALAAWSGMTALCGLAQNVWMLALARAGVGVGEGGYPAGLSLLSDYFPPQRRPMALAIFTGGGMLGLCLSFVVGSWIHAQWGWRAVFLIAGIPGLILAGLVLLLMREPQRGRFEAPVPAPRNYREGVALLLRNRAYVRLCSAAALSSFGGIGMLIWLPQFFIRNHQLSTKQVGLLFGPAAALGMFVGMMAGGWIANRLAARTLERPLLACIVPTIAVVPLYLFVLWTPSVIAALVVTFIAMAASACFAPAFQAAMQNVSEPRIRGTAAAIAAVIVGSISQGVLPLVVGAVSDALVLQAGAQALRWSLTLAQAFSLAGGLLFITAWTPTRDRLRTLAAV